MLLVAGLLHDGVGVLVDVLCCRFSLGRYAPRLASQPLLTPDTDPAPTSLLTDGADTSLNPLYLAEHHSNENSADVDTDSHTQFNQPGR